VADKQPLRNVHANKIKVYKEFTARSCCSCHISFKTKVLGLAVLRRKNGPKGPRLKWVVA